MPIPKPILVRHLNPPEAEILDLIAAYLEAA
jgi:hypothetical protein